jgi:hypothetical protein
MVKLNVFAGLAGWSLAESTSQLVPEVGPVSRTAPGPAIVSVEDGLEYDEVEQY